MLTIKQALQINPVFILVVNYDAGSIGQMLGEDRDLNLYLADMTIQYHSLVDKACLSFTVECLVSVTNNKVTIEEMNTNSDYQAIHARNICELTSINGVSVNIYQDNMSDDMQGLLINLIEGQPIYNIPEHYIIESY